MTEKQIERMFRTVCAMTGVAAGMTLMGLTAIKTGFLDPGIATTIGGIVGMPLGWKYLYREPKSRPDPRTPDVDAAPKNAS